MTKRGCLLLLLVSSVTYAATPPIDEAFGIRLGEPLDVNGDIAGLEPLSADEKGRQAGEVYRFEPRHPYAPLDEYTVVVAPGSKRVASIRAVGTFKNKKACRAEMDRLARVLTRKYGPRRHDPSAKFTGALRLVFGGGARRITVSCSGIFTRYKLKLIYRDKRVDLKAPRAGPVSEEAVRDTSGL